MENQHLALMIRKSIETYSERSALRAKVNGVWQATSYRELGQKIDALAGALLGLNVKKGEMVGIFSGNKPEWPICDFAILSIRGVTVPIYGTNTAKQAEYIIDDASIRLCFAGDQVQYDKLKFVIKKSKSLKKIIAMDNKIKISDDDSLYFSDLLKKGAENPRTGDIRALLNTATSDDLATLIYTSGTTGDPKGVMLAHSNFAHQLRAVDAGFNITEKERSLCFLPLSHVYERSWSYVVFSHGGENNYLEDTKKILEYLSEVRPTAMVSVPRLYEKIYSTVHDRLEKGSAVKRALFHWSFNAGQNYANRKKDKKFVGPLLGIRHAIADKLVLSKMRDVVGGPKNFFSAGGAPLAKEIEEFFFAAGLLVVQGYGLSETSPLISFNAPGHFKFGTVGRIVSEVQVRIDNETGEIQVKGPNVMKGYYNKPEDTKEAFTADGYLKTGDVGLIDQDGYLRITDRIKDLIITSGGKNIAPLHIETLVGMDHYIEQICTIGDKRKYVSALIIPNFPALEDYAKEKGITYTSREDLVKSDQIMLFYKERIDANSRELAQYEKIKAFTILAKEFTQDGGELTPTQKIKRKVVMEKYRDLVEKMYPEE